MSAVDEIIERANIEQREDGPRTWQPVDLGDVLDGTWAHPLPAWPEQQLPTRAALPAPVVSPARTPGQGPLAGLVTVVIAAAEGERNNLLNWASYKAGEHVRAARIDLRVAASALYDAAILVGLSEREAIATIASGLGARAVA